MYVKRSVPLSPGQVASLRAAVNANRAVTLRVGDGGNPVPLALTPTQVAHLVKNQRAGHGAEIKLSKAQIAAMKKDGGFLPFLAAIPAALAALAPAALGALGTGALSGAAGFGIQKALKAVTGSGLRLGPYRGGCCGGSKKNRKR